MLGVRLQAPECATTKEVVETNLGTAMLQSRPSTPLETKGNMLRPLVSPTLAASGARAPSPEAAGNLEDLLVAAPPKIVRRARRAPIDGTWI